MMKLEVLSPSYNRLSSSKGLLSVGASVPIGQSGLVHIWGYNDANVPRHIGIHWVVKDPDGIVVEDYEDWASVFGIKIEIDPDDDHEFIGGRFDLDKEGTYTIVASLLMNPDSPVVVDSYDGDLCTTTLEVPPEFELIEETIYPFAYIHEGDAETTTLTFKTDPFTPTDWITGLLASHVESEVRKDGGRVTEMRVYVDKTPLFWSDWRIDVVGIPPATVGVGVGIVWWVGVLIACLALIALILVTYHFIIKPLTRSRTPGLEDVKPGWDKETLMLTIHDSEEYWERPLTPTETLEDMSEDQLRDYLDQIAEEEVPPEAEFPWLPVIIAGGVVVLGVGAAIALTARPKE